MQKVCHRFKIFPKPGEFLTWTNQVFIFGTVNYQFLGYQNENFKLVSQQYKASDFSVFITDSNKSEIIFKIMQFLQKS
jgi:hypothetical protein